MKKTGFHPTPEIISPEDQLAQKHPSKLQRLGKVALRHIETYFRNPEECSLNESLKRELKDHRIYSGEATGYKRAVWFLGREYLDNDIPVVVTQPLGVKLPGYMTEHLSRICEATERPMLVVGSVGFHEERDFSMLEEDRFHMSWMASDVYSILEQIEADQANAWPSLSLKQFDVIGASQGAMVGLDLIAQAKYYDREIRKGVFTGAAGLITARKMEKESIKNFLQIAKQFGFDEPIGFAIHFLRSSAEERVRMFTRFTPTLRIPKSALKPVTLTAYNILNAPMKGIGKTLRSQHNSTEMSFLLYQDDAASTPSEWFNELRPDLSPHISITVREGRHIAGIVHSETDDYFIDNLRTEPHSKKVAS